MKEEGRGKDLNCKKNREMENKPTGRKSAVWGISREGRLNAGGEERGGKTMGEGRGQKQPRESCSHSSMGGKLRRTLGGRVNKIEKEKSCIHKRAHKNQEATINLHHFH